MPCEPVWLFHFYPQNPSIYTESNLFLNNILKELNSLANNLGVTLSNPGLGPKYDFLIKIFGWKQTLNFIGVVTSLKFPFLMNYDRFLYNLVKLTANMVDYANWRK